ncbi:MULTISPECIES: ribose-5-phosphate isomerase RpiA [unclassified Thermoactinomyces]|uniref:ribose-5-phosphate isomerase RpiA n=1 Tax=unclassified Thermoactinomyces TaxID=2634588 RepID=UPI0018DD757F|nr:MULTISPECIES: ribose-5-phosphate isomerase RpiA [unclassified Thermoactinomyces]MBH8596603.1 ribose-5-phosphate isomerase RpiA [Thermoactinomyces sp. CICC 10523]MBH8607868.1 ribose-5-phosphate isomerase RpiA [Thermoactinomyces sp. CICC 10521]
MKHSKSEKQIAGEKATDYIKDGMVVGLGTGSTVYYTIKRLGTLVKKGLKIEAVSTSSATTKLAKSLGIPLVSANDVSRIDVTIDGADEIDPRFYAIKGGGGALLYEKIVASISRKVICVVDSTKLTNQIGRFPLPVEVVPFAYKHVLKKLAKNGLEATLRLNEDKKPYLTDEKNMILDLRLGRIESPTELADWLNGIPGIVEHGLFIDLINEVMVGEKNLCKILKRKQDR